MKRTIRLGEGKLRRMIKEAVEEEMKQPQLWADVVFVNAGEMPELDEIYCGESDWRCEGNGEEAIEYLSQWDDGECELVTQRPRIAHDDTEHTYNGYTLLYNSSVGGCYLLYRPANEREIDWWEENVR